MALAFGVVLIVLAVLLKHTAVLSSILAVGGVLLLIVGVALPGISGLQAPLEVGVGDGLVYHRYKPWAYEIKSAAQMIVGMITVGGVMYSFAHHIAVKGHLGSTEDVTSELLGGIGLGLAAAAVIDLAYTLFTPGPDEALDPLMLGLAASMLVLVGGLDRNNLSLDRAVGLLALGLLLTVLFVTRLLFAETEDDDFKVWWVRRRLGLRVRLKDTHHNSGAPKE
jgi:hypothetical protein